LTDSRLGGRGLFTSALACLIYIPTLLSLSLALCIRMHIVISVVLEFSQIVIEATSHWYIYCIIIVRTAVSCTRPIDALSFPIILFLLFPVVFDLTLSVINCYRRSSIVRVIRTMIFKFYLVQIIKSGMPFETSSDFCTRVTNAYECLKGIAKRIAKRRRPKKSIGHWRNNFRVSNHLFIILLFVKYCM